jgi:hypothetical protein
MNVVAEFACDPQAIVSCCVWDVEFLTLFIPKGCTVVNEVKKITGHGAHLQTVILTAMGRAAFHLRHRDARWQSRMVIRPSPHARQLLTHTEL